MMICCPLFTHAKNDSIAWLKSEWWARHSFYILPTIDYTPETNWTFGISGANYFKIKQARKTSSVTYYAKYALNHQYSVNANTKLYFRNNYLYASLAVGRFPDYFYGTGNDISALLPTPELYNPMRVQLKLQPQWSVGNHWMIGPAFSLHYEHSDNTASTLLYAIFCQWGLGLVTTYDTRDNTFYPNKGTFFKTLLLATEPTFGSTARTVQLQTDLRQFIPLHKCTLALQFYADMLYQSEDITQMLPTIGGADIARGVRRGMWRDNIAVALQAELRIPIWKLIKGAVFSSIADVYNWKHPQWHTPKIGYGAGLRVNFNQAKVNIRFDVARNNYGDWKKLSNPNTWSFYLTATEAF
ncbi:MAG: BamA/TamA family outer membrane protein [Paludibacteraceae bacterium]|nr:BamA/TamA family outer membrane protein [Paludibacteraceae bacterium]